MRWNIGQLRQPLEAVISGNGILEGFVVQHDVAGMRPQELVLNARRIVREGDEPALQLVALDAPVVKKS